MLKVCLKVSAAQEGTPVFPCPSTPALLTSVQMFVIEHHPRLLAQEEMHSIFFPLFAAQVWWHAMVTMLCVFQKEIRGL